MDLLRSLLFFFLLLAMPLLDGAIKVGLGKAELTPQLGTPSAGYQARKGEGMEGVHDPLFASALYVESGGKKIVLCGVDHLGFTSEMVRAITQKVHTQPNLSDCEIYIGSSHTHSGGGAYLDYPIFGESLAGKYQPEIVNFYIQRTVDAILEASEHPAPARIGIGYGEKGGLSTYRALWPQGVPPLSTVAVIKVTTPDGKPLAVLFNFPVHPTVLKPSNRLFSADFVGYARDHLQTLLGDDLLPIYFNGAQGDINPLIPEGKEGYEACEAIGYSLAEKVQEIWNGIETSDALEIVTQKFNYCFEPKPTPQGLKLPIEQYPSELNALILNQTHAFLTIPGELSCLYDKSLKEFGRDLGYTQVSILGLTNDAHGYIILPEAWRRKTVESGLSFGGENYGEWIEAQAKELLTKTNGKK